MDRSAWARLADARKPERAEGAASDRVVARTRLKGRRILDATIQYRPAAGGLTDAACEGRAIDVRRGAACTSSRRIRRCSPGRRIHPAVGCRRWTSTCCRDGATGPNGEQRDHREINEGKMRRISEAVTRSLRRVPAARRAPPGPAITVLASCNAAGPSVYRAPSRTRVTAPRGGLSDDVLVNLSKSISVDLRMSTLRNRFI